MNEIERILKNNDGPEPTIIMSGDFNFPFVKWKRTPNGGCSWSYKAKTNATR